MSEGYYSRSHTASASRYNEQSYYVSPLEKLDEKTNKFQPGKVKANNKYKEHYQKGECQLFEISSSSYRYYHLHQSTPTDTLNDLIDYAKEVTHYTIDTEGQTRYRQSSQPALIQIEFLCANYPSIIILIETMHLPPENSQTFTKMEQLCRTIFSNNHYVYSWGDVKHELSKFYRYHLFEASDLDRIEKIDVQREFQKWFHETDPYSSERHSDPNNEYSLQFAIYKTFKEWLNKRMTLANWGCGIDLILETITIPRQFMNKRKEIMEDEEEIRQLMTIYAMNDCFSVTKLAYKIISNESLRPPMTEYCYELCEDEQTMDLNQNEQSTSSHVENDIIYQNKFSQPNDDETSVNASSTVYERYELDASTINHEMEIDDELTRIMKLHVPFNQYLTRKRDHQQKVHERYELDELTKNYEIGIDDEIPEIMKLHLPCKQNQSKGKEHHRREVRVRYEPNELIIDEIPEIMKLHLPVKQNPTEEQGSHQRRVHVRYEHQEEMEMISDDDAQQTASGNMHQTIMSNPWLTRTQWKNRKKRFNRYRFEVIRKIYHQFRITDVKEIFIHMNIYYVNINLVGRTLFIGLEDKATQRRVDELLGDDMLNEEHYYRLQKRKNRKRK